MIIFFLLCWPLASFSQIRHTKGSQMVGFSYSRASKTNGALGSYQYYIRDNMSLKASAVFENVAFNLTQYNALAFKPEFLCTVLSDKKAFYINAKAGLVPGVEFMENEVFNKKRSNFYYGELIGATLEIYLSSNFKLELEAEQRFLQKSLVSDYRGFFTIGAYIRL